MLLKAAEMVRFPSQKRGRCQRASTRVEGAVALSRLSPINACDFNFFILFVLVNIMMHIYIRFNPLSTKKNISVQRL